MRLGVIMDPLSSIHFKKDTTLGMLLEAQQRHYDIFYFDYQQLAIRDDVAIGSAAKVQVFRDAKKWYQLSEPKAMRLDECDIILMRKDPPFNEMYLYATYVLDAAEKAGVLVVNRPQALRDANEKVFAMHFKEYTPPSIVTASIAQLKSFWHEQEDIVCKPLNAMGGKFIVHIKKEDVNSSALFDLLTQSETVMIMAQKFIPEIITGDKRIILVNGEAVPHLVSRIPTENDWRGNLAQGASAKVQPLSSIDKRICAALKPELQKRGLYFVGIDVIGDYLTEINVTSPTGIREIENAVDINISAILFSELEKLLH